MALPEDIIRAEILIRLPVKSLIRFCAVCKSWKSLFSDPEFIKDNYNHNCTTKNDSLIINKVLYKNNHYFGDLCDISLFSLSNSSETRLFDVPDSNHKNRTQIEIIGSINGLVCMHIPGLVHEFILWNPAIKKAKKITQITQYHPILPYHHPNFTGFCWDGLEKDFQVVVCFEYRPYLYSCNSDSWSCLHNSPVRLCSPSSSVPSAIINGVPYWNSFCGENKLSVMKFEVGSKELKLLPQLVVSESDKHKFLIINWKECISALVYKPQSSNCLMYLYSFDERCGIWSKMSNIGPIPGFVDRLSNGFKYKDEILYDVCEVLIDARGDLYDHHIYVCYDQKTNSICNQKGPLRRCFSYMPSLIFLEGMQPLHHADDIFWT